MSEAQLWSGSKKKQYGLQFFTNLQFLQRFWLSLRF